MKSVIVGIALLGIGAGFLWGDIRTIDGSGNNIANPTWGVTGSNFLRVSTVEYSDGISTPAGSSRPSARVVSNQIVAQSSSILNAGGNSDFVWAWGQFLSHDIGLIGEADPHEPFNIPVPTGDAQFDPDGDGGKVIPLNRSTYDTTTGTGLRNPRQQRNFVTSWIDGSVVYGSDAARARWLRAGRGGRLKVTDSSAGDLLPYNDSSQENLGGNGTDLFVAGDVRANEQSVLLAMHTLFVREHNRLADEIAAANPRLTDEQIYQKARKIVGSEIQVITYKEFLPALIGDGFISEYQRYNPRVNGTLNNVFDTAAYRIGHTMLSSMILRLDEDGNEIPEGHLSLANAFFNTEAIEMEGGMESIFRGLVNQSHQEIDVHVVDELRNLLFIPEVGGLDLASLNIQRGRDHGLPDYNQLRVDFGLRPVTDFSQITSDLQLQNDLLTIFGNVNNIDPWVGMLAEDHADGAPVGMLMGKIIAAQFEALRDGDRFWYQICEDLTDRELRWLESITLSQIIEFNTDLDCFPENAFETVPEPVVGLALLLISPVILKRRRNQFNL